MTAQLTLFDDVGAKAPPTEGIKYAGSKLRLLPAILELAKKTKAKTVLDGFSGTTRVSQALARSGYAVHSNDIATWSEVFATCYLLNKKPPEAYRTLISHLNSVAPAHGWFSEHYGGEPNGGSSVQRDGLKKPWQLHNTRKLDGIREEIEKLGLSQVDKAVALTSLVLALDRVDSTLGHFASYLNEWAPRSYNELELIVPNLFISQATHHVTRRDVFEAACETCSDLAYFDPPYGSNNEKMPPSRVRYAAYYHLWTSVCLYDKPDLFGRVNRRKDSSDVISASVFEEFRRNEDGRFIAVDAIDRLLQCASAKWIILSYSTGGRATADELQEVMQRNGRITEAVEIVYRRNVMAGMRWTNEWLRDAEEPNREFLFLIAR